MCRSVIVLIYEKGVIQLTKVVMAPAIAGLVLATVLTFSGIKTTVESSSDVEIIETQEDNSGNSGGNANGG